MEQNFVFFNPLLINSIFTFIRVHSYILIIGIIKYLHDIHLRVFDKQADAVEL